MRSFIHVFKWSYGNIDFLGDVQSYEIFLFSTWIDLCNHPYNQDEGHFHHPPNSLMLSLYSLSSNCWRRQWHPTPVLLPGESHGWRSLVGCSPWGRWEPDTTERLHFHFSLSCIGEGNGNPLQCSCLENPRDGRAWWAAVHGVAQSRTWLKQLSSSSSGQIYQSFIASGFES